MSSCFLIFMISDNPPTTIIHNNLIIFAACKSFVLCCNWRMSLRYSEQVISCFIFMFPANCFARCPFKVFNPSKPAKYGINIRALCDSSFPYTFAGWCKLYNILTYYCQAQVQRPVPWDLIPNSNPNPKQSTIQSPSGTNKVLTVKKYFWFVSLTHPISVLNWT